MKDYKVGERFDDCGLIYEVREGDTCDGCAFWDGEEGCTDWQYRVGYCAGELRKDGKDVIFVQVGERQD